MIARLLGVFAVLLLAAFADASGCRAVAVHQRVTQHHAAAVHHAAVVQAVAVAEFVAVPLVVPAYSVGYAPQADAVAAEVQKLRAEIQQLKQAPPAAAGPPPGALGAKEHPGQAVALQSCARCHEAAVAKAKGKGFVLFEGGSPKLDAALALSAVREVVEGRMPPGKPLTPEQNGDLLGFLAGAGRK
jgi:mono/diheme cytochrome c family protein